jgi:hypothetical protein
MWGLSFDLKLEPLDFMGSNPGQVSFFLAKSLFVAFIEKTNSTSL